jgi:hypothetical protein
MKKFVLPLLSVLLWCGAGCISLEYTGEKLPVKNPDGKIAVFTDSAKITEPYQVLGTATVSGNYQDVSRDRMIGKLRDEARDCGADAILIVEQQVLAGDDKVSGNAAFMTAFDYDDTDHSWSQLYKDVDRNFVNSKRNRTRTTAGSANYFKRIIRAEFIRYKDAPAKPAAPAAPAANQ